MKIIETKNFKKISSYNDIKKGDLLLKTSLGPSVGWFYLAVVLSKEEDIGGIKIFFLDHFEKNFARNVRVDATFGRFSDENYWIAREDYECLGKQ